MKKTAAILLVFLFFNPFANSQEVRNDIKTALLIIDIQNFYFPGEGPGLVNAEEASLMAKEILDIFRQEEQLIVHVRHQSNRGFEIHENVMPIESEKVITKNEVNSFVGTDLQDYLNANNITRLVIIGMQTQMCVEAGVRAAHDIGYECVVIQDACATRDLTFNGHPIKAADVHASTLATLNDGGYASVIDLASFKSDVVKYISKPIK
jgi:nicotinamidase-related amidase